jgi:predicted NACHT family NTPase
MLPPTEKRKSRQIWDFLDVSAKPATRRIAIIAPPGAGKTTLLRHLTLTYAKNAQRCYHPHSPRLIPVLLLRDIQKLVTQGAAPDLANVLEMHVTDFRLQPPPGWFKGKLHRGRCLIMLDRLDEIAEDIHRQQVSGWINEQMGLYASSYFIITSRPFGYYRAPVEQVEMILEVQRFNLSQMEQFVQNWYLQTEMMRRRRREDASIRMTATQKANDLIARVKKHPALAAMAYNPLLLTMMATVHDNCGALPGRRVELYAQMCDVLLERRQTAKGLQSPLTAAQIRAVLQPVALVLMREETREFSITKGVGWILDNLRVVADSKTQPEEFLNEIENKTGMLVQKERHVYEFVHHSFQEYLAAAEIKERNNESLLLDHLDEPWWAETARLFAAQTDAT